MRRPHAAKRQLEKETVEVRVVRIAVAENNRNVTVQAVCGSAFANRNDARHRQCKVIHSCSPPSPGPPSPGTCPGGQTGTSHARRSVAREGTARRARVPPVRYLDKSPAPSLTRCRLSR